MIDLWSGLRIIIISFAGGIGVGTAVISFLIALDIIPRLVQLTKTYGYSLFYELILILGIETSTIFYLFNLKLPLGNFVAVIIGLIMGVFIGMLAAALTEVLNVLPILSKRLNVENNVIFVLLALSIGKIVGSLLYWLVPNIYQ